MLQKKRRRQTGNGCLLASGRACAGQEEKKKLEEEVDREIRAGLAALKEPLAQFAEETAELLTDLQTPPLSHFTALVRDTMGTRPQVTWHEIISFSTIAITFFSLIGYLLSHGYLLPVAGFFATATLLLPTAVLFTAED